MERDRRRAEDIDLRQDRAEILLGGRHLIRLHRVAGPLSRLIRENPDLRRLGRAMDLFPQEMGA